MANIIIHYFTGTGNTAHCVKLMTESLQSHGHEVKIWQVRQHVLPPAGDFDYHIIAFPVLAFAAPVIMKKYIHKMPRVDGIKTAMLAVNGCIIHDGKLIKGFTGHALEQLEKILLHKNYDVFLTGNASFPENWTQTTNPCSPEDIKAIFPQGEAEAKVFIQKFLLQKKELYRCGVSNKLWSYQLAGLFGFIGRRALGKFYVADERCTGCAICAKSCPAGTISMWHKTPRWATTCEDCNRCINVCPEQAIQVSLPLFAIQTIINFILTAWAIWAIIVFVPDWTGLPLLPLIFLEALLIVAATLFLLWVLAVPFDAFFRLLMRIPRVRRFFSISYTRKFRRYVAPGFDPLGR